MLVGPQEWRQRKKGFVTRALSTPNPHKPYLAILQVLKDVHELRQGFDARVSAVEGILLKYVPPTLSPWDAEKCRYECLIEND